MKSIQQRLYRFVVIVLALVILVIVGKANVGSVFNHQTAVTTIGLGTLK